MGNIAAMKYSLRLLYLSRVKYSNDHGMNSIASKYFIPVSSHLLPFLFSFFSSFFLFLFFSFFPPSTTITPPRNSMNHSALHRGYLGKHSKPSSFKNAKFHDALLSSTTVCPFFFDHRSFFHHLAVYSRMDR